MFSWDSPVGRKKPADPGGRAGVRGGAWSYTYNRRVIRREDKPERFVSAKRAATQSPFGRLGKHGTRKRIIRK
jgi:hypothetical protein